MVDVIQQLAAFHANELGKKISRNVFLVSLANYFFIEEFLNWKTFDNVFTGTLRFSLFERLERIVW